MSEEKIEQLLNQIDEAASQARWNSVRDLAQQILSLDAEHIDAAATLRMANRQLRMTEKTEAESQKKEESLPDAFVGGRYSVKKLIGEGARKKVYLCRDTSLDRDIAFSLVKTEGLDEDARKRVIREAKVMGRLGAHPNIVTVHDIGEEDDQPYIVTEHMDGGDVETHIEDAQGNRLPLTKVLDIVKSICRGLEFAHSQSIVHRDLKPSNVWLTSRGEAKIGDFGLALSLAHSRLTQEGTLLGTVSYIPPEQATGGKVTPLSDLYSLGAMLYEMVTGRPPFMGDDNIGIIEQHINTPPVAPTWHNPECPKALEALILRLLSKNPTDRPASASEVLLALEAIDLEAAKEIPSEEVERTLDSVAGGVFVGRKREMSALRAVLEDALASHGNLVMLVGEPGIGKTRTSQQLSTFAQLRGARVLWGRSYENQEAPPYWPWVQAIRSYVRSCDTEKLRKEMSSVASIIAEIVEDVKERIPDIKPPRKLDDPESARFRLFDAVSSFLKTASRSQPLVVVLDDLHWSDGPSLKLLEFVSHELEGGRLLILGAYRDVEIGRKHPLQQTLAELTREQLFERVLLRGLQKEDVERFIELAAGVKPPDGLVDAVYTHTEGNPLFVTEVVRLLVQEGELEEEKLKKRIRWTVRIPEGVREVIGRRLDRLSERCNEILAVAAVLGREFTLRQLNALIEDITEDRLIEVLDEALMARVAEELPDAIGHYQFTHALTQETLLEELTVTRRVRLHAKIAKALEELYGDKADDHAAELVTHFVQAETVIGKEKVIHYSHLAGEQAFASHAYEDALEHFQRGLDVIKDQKTDHAKASLLFGRAKAKLATGHVHLEVEDDFTRAFDYYHESGDVEHAVEIAGYPMPLLSFQWMPNLINRAMKMVTPNTVQEARMIPLTAVETAFHDSYEEAIPLFERAQEIAQRQNDPVLECRLLKVLSTLEMYFSHAEQVIKISRRLFEIVRILNDLQAECNAYDAMSLAAMETGDAKNMREYAEAGLRAAETLRDQSRLRHALVLNQLAVKIVGDWVSARGFSDQHLSLLLPNREVPLKDRILIEYETGNFDTAGKLIEDFMVAVKEREHKIKTLMTLAPVAAHITGKADFFDIVEEYVENSLKTIPFEIPEFVDRRRMSLALMAAEKRERDTAAELYRDLIDIESNLVPAYGGLTRHRALGIIAMAAGKIEKAIPHYRKGYQFCKKAGYLPELAWICCDWSDALMQRGTSEDRSKAKELLEEGLSISGKLGMRPLKERITERIERLSAKETYPDGLTKREVEVLRALAKGQTNQEIAVCLFISERTVAKHISNILFKTKTGNRTEAAQYAAQHGLTSVGPSEGK